MRFHILSVTGSPIATEDAPSLTIAVEALNLSGASLSAADLREADLTGVDLSRANLRAADLSGADLRGANLSRANLRGANLSRANLRRANLSRANLRRANLRGANLSRANLSGANLSGADLSRANLRGANLRGVSIIVPKLHQKILAALDAGGTLEMSTWHTCKTAHCRAGWAIHLAGEAGLALESAVGSSVAGALIHQSSCPWLPTVPDFHASNEAALADIQRCAALEGV